MEDESTHQVAGDDVKDEDVDMEIDQPATESMEDVAAMDESETVTAVKAVAKSGEPIQEDQAAAKPKTKAKTKAATAKTKTEKAATRAAKAAAKAATAKAKAASEKAAAAKAEAGGYGSFYVKLATETGYHLVVKITIKHEKVDKSHVHGSRPLQSRVYVTTKGEWMCSATLMLYYQASIDGMLTVPDDFVQDENEPQPEYGDLMNSKLEAQIAARCIMKKDTVTDPSFRPPIPTQSDDLPTTSTESTNLPLPADSHPVHPPVSGPPPADEIKPLPPGKTKKKPLLLPKIFKSMSADHHNIQYAQACFGFPGMTSHGCRRGFVQSQVLTFCHLAGGLLSESNMLKVGEITGHTNVKMGSAFRTYVDSVGHEVSTTCVAEKDNVMSFKRIPTLLWDRRQPYLNMDPKEFEGDRNVQRRLSNAAKLYAKEMAELGKSSESEADVINCKMSSKLAVRSCPPDSVRQYIIPDVTSSTWKKNWTNVEKRLQSRLGTV